MEEEDAFDVDVQGPLSILTCVQKCIAPRRRRRRRGHRVDVRSMGERNESPTIEDGGSNMLYTNYFALPCATYAPIFGDATG
jgi:hypothetical protein